MELPCEKFDLHSKSYRKFVLLIAFIIILPIMILIYFIYLNNQSIQISKLVPNNPYQQLLIQLNSALTKIEQLIQQNKIGINRNNKKQQQYLELKSINTSKYFRYSNLTSQPNFSQFSDQFIDQIEKNNFNPFQNVYFMHIHFLGLSDHDHQFFEKNNFKHSLNQKIANYLENTILKGITDETMPSIITRQSFQYLSNKTNNKLRNLMTIQRGNHKNLISTIEENTLSQIFKQLQSSFQNGWDQCSYHKDTSGCQSYHIYFVIDNQFEQNQSIKNEFYQMGSKYFIPLSLKCLNFHLCRQQLLLEIILNNIGLTPFILLSKSKSPSTQTTDQLIDTFNQVLIIKLLNSLKRTITYAHKMLKNNLWTYKPLKEEQISELYQLISMAAIQFHPKIIKKIFLKQNILKYREISNKIFNSQQFFDINKFPSDYKLGVIGPIFIIIIYPIINFLKILYFLVFKKKANQKITKIKIN